MSIGRYLFALILLSPLLFPGKIKDVLVKFIIEILPASARLLNLEVIGHALIFAAIAVILFYWKINARVIAITVLILALATEAVQTVIPQRSATLQDVSVDVMSSFSVIFTVVIFMFLKNSYQNRQKKASRTK